MLRIDVATATGSLPTPAAAGTAGYFTEGNPGTGTPATVVTADWLNAVQEELMAVIADGGLTASKTTLTQVRDAIRVMIASGAVKAPVRAASTANINLSSPGSTIDGVTMATGERFLAKDQSTNTQNGVYVWNGSAVAATRATDADVWTELPGALVVVQEGTVNADRVYLCTSNAGGTLGSTAITWAQVGATGIQSSALTTLSGTSTDVTGIPAGVKEITIGISGMSTNGTSAIIIQLGDSGGVETTGYLGTGTTADGATVGSANSTSGFMISRNPAASRTQGGTVTLLLIDPATNLWACSSQIGDSSAAFMCWAAGTKALSAVIDRIRFTTAGGTETLDAGSFTVNWKI
jgi:hypothetical protein